MRVGGVLDDRRKRAVDIEQDRPASGVCAQRSQRSEQQRRAARHLLVRMTTQTPSGWVRKPVPRTDLGTDAAEQDALALFQLAVMFRVTRGAALQALRGSYVEFARAKGASRLRLAWQHVLPNSLLPLMTVSALAPFCATLEIQP